MTSRIEFIRGGVPSDAEIAAVVLALTPVPVAVDESTDGDDPVLGPAPWALAGLREGLGGRPAAAPSDLVLLR